MAPSVNSVRSANTKKSGIDSTFRAEYGEEARFVNKSAEDSNPFSQAGSASLYSERLSAENNTLIQLNSQHVQGTSTDRDVPGSEGLEVKGSQPLKEARCYSVVALPSAKSESSASVRKIDAPQLPVRSQMLQENLTPKAARLPDKSISAARVPTTEVEVARSGTNSAR